MYIQECVIFSTLFCRRSVAVDFAIKKNKMWLFDLTTDLLKYKFCKGRQQQQSFWMHFIHIFLTIDANPTCRLSFIPWPPEALNFQLYACYFLIAVVASVYKERKRAKTITPIFLDTIIIKNITHHNAPGKLFLSVILRLQKNCHIPVLWAPNYYQNWS